MTSTFRRALRALALTALFLPLAAPALSQSQAAGGTIEGTITDESASSRPPWQRPRSLRVGATPALSPSPTR